MGKSTTLPDGKYIKRCIDFTEVRVNEEGNLVEGHAAVYGSESRIGNYFSETIERGAFDKTDLSDVALFLNHKWDEIPLARSRKSIPNSSMRVTPDDKGLFISTQLDIENNANARALISAISRKDISGMSFAFVVGEEDWTELDSDMPKRSIKSISKVLEVSAVTNPAYPTTDIDARSNSLESDRIALERAKGNNIDNELELAKELFKLKNGGNE